MGTGASAQIGVGESAPSASLPDQRGEPITIPAEGEPTVLVFYRGDFCPYCNAQLASYARRWEPFAASGTKVFGISVDPPERNRGMVDKLMLPYPLLSDADGSVIRAYAAWNEEKEEAHPAIFVIDRSGSVRYAYVGEDFTDRAPDAELHAALEGHAKTTT